MKKLKEKKGLKLKKVIPEGIYCFQDGKRCVFRGREISLNYVCPFYVEIDTNEYSNIDRITGKCVLLNGDIKNNVKICACNLDLINTELIPEYDRPYTIYL